MRPTQSTVRRSREDASACRTTASGATRTRWPAAWARQHRSMSSRIRGSRRSKPPSSSKTSRRISMPAVDTASTGLTWSCWPWSCSRRSRPVQRRPLWAMVTPTSRSCLRSYQPRSLGPMIATSLPSSRSFSTTRSSWARASASGAQSSCRSHSHCSGSPWGSSGMSYASSRQVRVTGSQPLGRLRYGRSSGVSTPGLYGRPPRRPGRSRCAGRGAAPGRRRGRR